MFLTGLIQSPAMGDLLCYARVSTLEQASRLQADALKSNGCYRVFPHWASVALDECPELAKLFDQMRPGDTVGVWRLDRPRPVHQWDSVTDRYAAALVALTA